MVLDKILSIFPYILYSLSLIFFNLLSVLEAVETFWDKILSIFPSRVNNQLTEREFDPLTEPSVYSREALPSRVIILNQVVDALTDPRFNKIGIYGIGGVGKSTLAKEVHRKAVEDNLFDYVVMVVVSRTPDRRRIKEEIADMRLAHSKALIILDDIWKKLDLRSIGIPCDCKILLTSRRKDVLSDEMGTQKDFSLQILSEDEARSLFEMTIGEAKDTELQAIANEVVEKCAGLPLLIIMVATYLKNKNLSSWRDTLKKLSDCGNEEFHEKMHKVLSSIYESLPRNEVKSIFLLCALFGESNIPINRLLTYAMGLGLFRNIINVQDVRDRLFRMIEKLKIERLLLDGDMKGYVKMHDVVLDVARSMATKEQHAFYGISGHGLREWPSEDCTMISLAYSCIDKLPQGLEYPKVELFSLLSKYLLLKIPHLYFEGFRELKVLNLTGMHFMSLPSSLRFLTNLNSLYLHQCDLDDVAIIGELKQLEFLSFVDSCIVELPKQIEQLSQLKLLDLTNCTQLKVFPANVLSKLSILEELYMGNSFVRWDVEGNISVMELDKLLHLTTLKIHVIDAKKLPNCLFSRGLQRYRICIGNELYCGEEHGSSRWLKLRLKASIHMEHGLKKLLSETESLCLYEFRGIQNWLHELDGKGSRLKHLHIEEDDLIQNIINSTMWGFCHTFPTVETLSLRRLNRLEEICHGQLETGSFCKLRILKVSLCDKLMNLFSYSSAKCLPQLQEIDVASCDNMKAIIDKGSEDEVMEFLIQHIIYSTMWGFCHTFPTLEILSLYGLNRLEEICHGQLATESFCKLRILKVKFCHKLRNIFSYSSAKCPPQLQEIDVAFCYNMEAIIDKGSEEEVMEFTQLSSLKLTYLSWLRSIFGGKVSCPNLTSLIIMECGRMEYIFKTSIIKSLFQLKRLVIQDCDSVEEIILNEENISKIVFPNLNLIRLGNLPNLKRFSNCYPIEFQSLKEMEIIKCQRLMNIISIISDRGNICDIPSLFNDTVTFPNLQTMRISDMESLKHIGDNQLTVDSFYKLKSLTISNCRYLLAMFSSNVVRSFQRLEDQNLSYFHKIEDKYQLRELNSNERAPFDLRHLKIDSMASLKHIWISENGDGVFTFQNLKSFEVSFQNLTTLHVADCDKLENLVTPSTAKTMVHLIELRVTYCEMIKEIVANDGDDPEHEITFDCLKFLELRYLPTFYKFCSGNYIFHFPLLEEVIVENCLRMKIFCDGVLSTPKLQGVRHWKYEEKVQYWKGNLNATIASQCFRKRVLQNADKWYMIEDPSFSKAILSSQLQFLINLKKIIVSDCEFVSVVFDLEDISVELLPQLEELQLINLPKLSELWNKDPVRMFCFQKLRLLKVLNCSILKYIFTQSMTSSLIELQEVKVENCKMMEAIIKEEKAKKTKLPKISLPSLNKISIKGCPSMKEFVSPILSREKNPRPDEKGIWEQIIGMHELHEIAMPKLEELRIDWDIIKHKLNDNNQPDFFSRLKVIELFSPSNSFPTMEKLVLCDSLVEKIIIHGLENHHESIPWLEKIILSKLPKLNSMVFDNDPRRVSISQNLQVLQVWKCHNLMILEPLEGSFQNLTFLQVSTCDGLINLITTTIAKSLVQLKTMYVGRCKRLQEIVQPGWVREESEIGFNRLEYLVLDDLPRLTSFCSSDETLFDFPYLEEVFIIECPNMKMFARVLNAPKLIQVQTGGKKYEWEWKDSLNSTIQALSTRRVLEFG